MAGRRIILRSFPRERESSAGSPEFTNEVQHLPEEVLLWDGGTNSSPWTIDARLPAFKPVAARSGKSRQHQDRPASTVSRELKAQPRPARRLQAWLRPAADQGTALDGLSPRTRARPAPHRVGAPGPRLVARTGGRTARLRGRPQGDQRREHLPLHLCSDRAPQGLSLAALPAARQEQTRLARPLRWKLRMLH